MYFGEIHFRKTYDFFFFYLSSPVGSLNVAALRGRKTKHKQIKKSLGGMQVCQLAKSLLSLLEQFNNGRV